MLKFRVDDFPGSKPDEFYKHNIENFNKFDDVMADFDVQYTLGIIPKYLEKDHIYYFNMSTDDIKLALHGIEHDERYLNEFHPSLTEKDIQFKLSEALKKIADFDYEGSIIDTYIPPHNVFDFKTCNALASVGFKKVLCGPGSEDSTIQYCRSLGLECHYSYSPYEYGRSDEMLQGGAIKYLTDMSKYKLIWVTLHWPWEYNIGLVNLKNFLEKLRKNNVTIGW